MEKFLTVSFNNYIGQLFKPEINKFLIYVMQFITQKILLDQGVLK